LTDTLRLVGYVRVSTEEQSYDLQVDAMKAAGVEPDFIFADIESGRTQVQGRPGLRDALKACRPGSTLLVWKLDRLGRNTGELIRTVDRLHERGVNFRSLTQSEISTEAQSSGSGRLIFTLFAALAQFESDQLSERTKAGQRAARAKGVKMGRKTFAELYVDTGRVAEFQQLRKSGKLVREALAELKIPKATYIKWKDAFNETAPIDDIGGTDED
jgi:DNA invertase Pin-like site-specific DNA recombinase